jgi:DnaJ family protein C protein 9
MNALGANLSPNFTPGELRRAFRRLALQYHPDRHTSRSADERAQLSDRFARSRDAYRVLTIARRG